MTAAAVSLRAAAGTESVAGVAFVRSLIVRDLKAYWHVTVPSLVIVTAITFAAVVRERGFLPIALLTIPMIVAAGAVGI